MTKEIRYLTYYELQDIFEDVYATGWPSPKITPEDEQFALKIQQATMKLNGLTVPTVLSDN